MSIPQERSEGPIRAPQSLIGGLVLIALAALALWLVRDLAQGSLGAMGPAMLPRILAVGVGLAGLALSAFAFLKNGEALERWSLRGPLFIVLAVLAFALTLRPFAFGPVTLPGFGLLVAGPLAIVLGGFATPEARLRELVILGLSLTPVCMLLFGDLLNLPIPIFPQALAGLFPADWSQKAILRATAGLMLTAAALVFLLVRPARPAPVDVASHSGGL